MDRIGRIPTKSEVDKQLEQKGSNPNLRISFATDSRINGVQKSDFSEIAKKRLGQKCFLLLSRPLLNLFHTANKFLKIDQFY
ncbi:hypothetical protein EGW35_07565 [Enterococcus durans]|nr:hypothetical protein CUM72_00320 [Enterococcus durans]ROX82828.1 hypothetical protein EGW35_07565 [Enterococcus durans]TKN19714.1 hypothetical protein DVW83_02820 [Enterococcus sp. VV15]